MLRASMAVPIVLVSMTVALGACSGADTIAPEEGSTLPALNQGHSGFGHRSGEAALLQAVISDEWIELLNTGDLSLADGIYHEDLLPHIPHYPQVTDLASYTEETVTATHALVADFQATAHDLFAHGDRVVGRFTASGLMGGVLPYTNTWIIIFRFKDGKIAEEWWQFDLLGVQEQLGAVPATRPAYTWGEPSTVTGDPGHGPRNQALVRRAEQVWNSGNLNQLEKVYSADFANHDPVMPSVVDREGLGAFVQASRAAFPDLRVTFEDIVASGDRVAVRRRVIGTHDGPFAGIPATGRSVEWTGTTIYRVADRKIIEAWWSYDALGLMLQLTGAE